MTIMPTDEMLVAYLDGELGPQDHADIEAAISDNRAIAARLAFLRRSSLPYASAFDRLLDQAPMEKLETMLPAIKPAPIRMIGRRAFLAAAFGCLVTGVAIDRAFLAARDLLATTDEEAAWRAEVADYLTLYTPETLQHMNIDPRKRTEQLRLAGQRLGLQLDPFAMHLGRLEMRRAQILEYDGKPVGQIMYLDPDHGPVALCITASSAGFYPMRNEQRNGMNLVYWSSDTHAFVMVARNPFADLHARAREIRYELADRNQA